MATKVKGRAKFDFVGKEELKQLSFKKGEVVTINQQYDNGWWAGELSGKIGYVPATYLEILSDAPTPSAPPPVASRPPPSNPNPASRPSAPPPAARPPPTVASRPPPVAAKPPPVANRPAPSSPGATRPPPSTRTPPPIANRPPKPSEDDFEEDNVPAPVAHSVSSTTTTVPLPTRTAPVPGARPPSAAPGAGRGMNNSGGAPGGAVARPGPPAGGRGMSNSGGAPGAKGGEDWEELDSLIKKMQSEMNDLKGFM